MGFCSRWKTRSLAAIAAGMLITLMGSTGLCAHNPGKPVVYFGVNLRYDPIVMYKRYQPMMDYLTQTTPYRFELRISRNYNEALQHMAQGKTQLVSIGDGAVVDAMIFHGAVPVLKPLNPRGEPLYQSCVVVSNTSDIRSLKDLKGKKIALGYHHSITGNLVARQFLQSRGLGDGVATIISLGKHSSVAKAVLKGETDAGVIKDVVGRVFASRGLRVIDCSEALPSTPIVAAPNASPKLIAEVTKALVRLDRLNPAHHKVMRLWDEEYRYGFAPVQKGDYDQIVQLYRSIPFGCGTGCH